MIWSHLSGAEILLLRGFLSGREWAVTHFVHVLHARQRGRQNVVNATARPLCCWAIRWGLKPPSWFEDYFSLFLQNFKPRLGVQTLSSTLGKCHGAQFRTWYFHTIPSPLSEHTSRLSICTIPAPASSPAFKNLSFSRGNNHTIESGLILILWEHPTTICRQLLICHHNTSQSKFRSCREKKNTSTAPV